MRERVLAAPFAFREAGREGVLAIAGLGWTALYIALLGVVFFKGAGVISYDYLTSPVEDAGRAGGIAPILVSTAVILGVAMLAAFPLSLGVAVYISEYLGHRSLMGRWISGSLDVLAAVPSVVFGLFGYAVFCDALGMGYSLLAGGLTLACMVLPLSVKASLDGLSAVPEEQRAAAKALGLSRVAMLWHVARPYAAPGIAAGFLLSVARALAETAALQFTSGYVLRMPESVLDSGRSISIHIYDLAMNVSGGDKRAYAAALVLIVALLVLSSGVSFVQRRMRRQL